uniref:RNase H type-1 domain-containing protein n=1 Tax=Nicotiana tabacum TaxID=4097 RepID=A0A1S3XQP1_TOBAC
MKNKFLNWNLFFPFAIWHIWINRNNNNQNNTENPININHIIARAIELRLLTENNILTSPKIHLNIKWHRPPKGQFKLNIDASFNKNLQQCGLGGVIRNVNGHWIVGFAKPAHARGSLHVEIKALLAGLKTAHTWGMFPLQIETDSTKVADMEIATSVRNCEPFKKLNLSHLRNICRICDTLSIPAIIAFARGCSQRIEYSRICDSGYQVHSSHLR